MIQVSGKSVQFTQKSIFFQKNTNNKSCKNSKITCEIKHAKKFLPKMIKFGALMQMN